MPALVLFGRRWQVGTDDFVLSSFVDLIIRLSWLLAAIFVFWKNEHNLQCPGGGTTRIFYYGIFIIAHLIIFLDILLLQNSRKGSIFIDSKQRKCVPCILYLRVGTEFLEIIWNVLGTVGLYQNVFDCDTAHDSTIMLKIMIAFNWIMLSFQLMYFIYLFDPLGRSKREFDELAESSNLKLFGIDMPLAKTKYTKKWQRRWRCWLGSWCCVSDDAVLDSYREVAKLFGTMLAEDIVNTDVLAGLVLVSLKQKQERLAKLEQVTSSTGINPPSSNAQVVITKEFSASKIIGSGINALPQDWKSVQHIENYVRFACSTYGYIYALACKKDAVRKQCKNSYFCNCLPGKNHPVEVEGDNCCFCCLSGAKTTLDIPFDDIIYATFKDSTFQKPFIIALDHKFKSVVICCRGTLSLKDCLTDMTGWPAHIHGYPQTYKAHHGMLLSCIRLKEKIQEMKTLELLFEMYPDYGLVITGQSLGAGMATILSFLFRPQYPQLKCYVYSPPGGLLSYDAAEHCKEFVTAVVYGDDFVARLGILQFERLKFQLIKALRECKTPKYRLLLGGYCCFVPVPELEYILNTGPQDISVEVTDDELRFTGITSQGPNMSSQEGLILDNGSASNNNDDCDTELKIPAVKRQLMEGTKFPTIEGMYPPGNIFYITKLPKSERHLNQSKWTWRWAERHEFDDIIVSSKMFLDHIPLTMPRALHNLATNR